MTTIYRPIGGTAVLVDAGRIGWLGPGADAPEADRVIELGRATITAALVDAHVHSTATGLALEGLDLRGSVSLAQALDQIAQSARAGRGRVVLGTGWDETTWPEQRAPSRAELDRASYGGAVYLARADVHSAVCSSALLAAVPHAVALPGYHESGHLRLAAHHAARQAAYAAITATQRSAAQRATRGRAAALGIGCLQEMSGPEVAGEADLRGLLELAATEPGPAVLAYWGELHRFDLIAELGLAGAGGDLFCDGALGSHTAALVAPYADAEGCATLRFSLAEVTEHVRAATLAGVQAGFHVIGDAAIDQVIKAVTDVAAELGVAAVQHCRHRLEHVEMASPWHVRAMASLGMVASVQPAFDAAWGGPDRMYAQRLGAERAAGLNPLAGFAAAGVPLAFGSDAPVTPLDPWGAVAAAAAHRSPGSRLDPAAGFAAATSGGWYAVRHDDPSAGTLTLHAPASFAVWDDPGGLLALLDRADDPPRCRLTVADDAAVFDPEGLVP